jgi:hypothetical protein
MEMDRSVTRHRSRLRPCLPGPTLKRTDNRQGAHRELNVTTQPHTNGTTTAWTPVPAGPKRRGGSHGDELLALPPHPLVQHFSRRGPDAHESKPHARRRSAGLLPLFPHHLARATDRRLPIGQDEFHGELITGLEPLGRRQHQPAKAQILRVAEENLVIPFALHLQHQQGRGQPVSTISRDKLARFAPRLDGGGRRPPLGRRSARWRALTAHQ